MTASCLLGRGRPEGSTGCTGRLRMMIEIVCVSDSFRELILIKLRGVIAFHTFNITRSIIGSRIFGTLSPSLTRLPPNSAITMVPSRPIHHVDAFTAAFVAIGSFSRTIPVCRQAVELALNLVATEVMYVL